MDFLIFVENINKTKKMYLNQIIDQYFMKQVEKTPPKNKYGK